MGEILRGEKPRITGLIMRTSGIALTKRNLQLLAVQYRLLTLKEELAVMSLEFRVGVFSVDSFQGRVSRFFLTLGIA